MKTATTSLKIWQTACYLPDFCLVLIILMYESVQIESMDVPCTLVFNEEANVY